MIDRSDGVTIDRPVEEVFAYLTDTSNDPALHAAYVAHDAEAQRRLRREPRAGTPGPATPPVGRSARWCRLDTLLCPHP